jgi:hypothetical protein
VGVHPSPHSAVGRSSGSHARSLTSRRPPIPDISAERCPDPVGKGGAEHLLSQCPLFRAQIGWEPFLRCPNPVVAPLLMCPASFSLTSGIFLVALLSWESRGGWYQLTQESRGRAVPTRLPSLDAASPARHFLFPAVAMPYFLAATMRSFPRCYFFPACSVDRDDRWAPIVLVC